MAVEPVEKFPFSVSDLLKAYPKGTLPNMFPDGKYHLYAPDMRAVLDGPEMHVSKEVQRFIRQNRYAVEFNQRFETVMRECVRPEYRWITEEVIHVYTDLHRGGWAHSAEALAGDQLVGGLYGVAMGRVFFIESMFTRSDNASKVALFFMLAELKSQNFELIDLQYLTPHLKSIGGIEIAGADFASRLDHLVTQETKWGKNPLSAGS